MKISLGENLPLDLKKLIETRLLVNANSGAGKSWTIRKLLEITNGKVQHIVLDIEGDFASLREKYDYVLAGKNGDIPADPRSAAILAKKVLELETNIIIDLYELRQSDRIEFVREFLEAMIDVPKKLWHPCLVIIDEAHIFAPESGKCESGPAVIDICTRGRKRGFCPVLATQRLSKLHKDAAAECNNVLIGRTGLDIDIKRASDALGMNAREAAEKLRDLEPGEFFAYGPAISKQVVRGQIGAVQTRHPKAGNRGFSHVPPATARVKSTLSKLTDIPKEVEQEKATVESLQKKVRELEAKARQSPVITATVAKPTKAQLEAISKRALAEATRLAQADVGKAVAELKRRILTAVNEPLKIDKKIAEKMSTSHIFTLPKPLKVDNSKIVTHRTDQKSDGSPQEKWGVCERKVLGFLLVRESMTYTKTQVAAMTGYAQGSGSFNNALSKLNTGGLILRESGGVRLSEDPAMREMARSIVGNEMPHRLEDWVGKLGACERKVYELVLNNQNDHYSKEDLGRITGYEPTSGSFNNALSRLNTLGLISRNRGGTISFNAELAVV